MSDYIKELRRLIGSRPLIMCGANVLLLDEQNRVLLQHRRDNLRWGLPGGAMEPGETLEETARREVLEETGLTCHELILFNVYSGQDFYYRYPNGDEVHNVTASFLCRSYTGQMAADGQEGTDLQFFSPKDLPGEISPMAVRIIHELFAASELRQPTRNWS